MYNGVRNHLAGFLSLFTLEEHLEKNVRSWETPEIMCTSTAHCCDQQAVDITTIIVEIVLNKRITIKMYPFNVKLGLRACVFCPDA